MSIVVVVVVVVVSVLVASAAFISLVNAALGAPLIDGAKEFTNEVNKAVKRQTSWGDGCFNIANCGVWECGNLEMLIRLDSSLASTDEDQFSV
mmetsp:Transcript_21300/g.58988  ORF Transcript_21300/g.58988 Transcript_21300/m.58988 type:complete len:93 (-) Transcript_21300:237-515(-)